MQTVDEWMQRFFSKYYTRGYDCSSASHNADAAAQVLLGEGRWYPAAEGWRRPQQQPAPPRTPPASLPPPAARPAGMLRHVLIKGDRDGVTTAMHAFKTQLQLATDSSPLQRAALVDALFLVRPTPPRQHPQNAPPHQHRPGAWFPPCRPTPWAVVPAHAGCRVPLGTPPPPPPHPARLPPAPAAHDLAG